MKVIKTKLNYAKFYNTFDISSLRVEDAIPFDLYIKRDKDHTIILEAGTLISEKLYSKLKKQENLYLDKKDEEKRVLSCKTLKYYIRYNSDNVEKRLQLLYEVNDKLFKSFLFNEDDKIDVECVTLIVKSIIFLVKHDTKILKHTIPLFRNADTMPNHSLHVSMYSVKIGNLLHYNDNELLQLGTAALLLDIGNKKVDSDILNKDSKLTKEEAQKVHRHIQYSIDILKNNYINNPYIIDAVMNHHERYDGTGYPSKKEQEEISVYASILAICDVFDALTSIRPHRKELSSFDSLKMMLKDKSMINQFNHNYIHLLLKSL
jgi:HD-GYP domain-containing protein (c-di-GMP phosphodiesterase class II)